MTVTKRAREASLEWVNISEMRVAEALISQRPLRPAWVDKLVADFELEEMGVPTVNHRDGFYFIIDGQHRVEALRRLGFGEDAIQCWAYSNMSEQEEAERFLTLNNNLIVDSFTKFKVSVNAGRQDESAVNKVLLSLGLTATTQATPGAVRAVGTLMRVYRRSGAETLESALRIVRDAYGDPGFLAEVIDGVAHVMGRHPDLEEDRVIDRLSKLTGGPSGLVQRGRVQRERHGGTFALGVAAATVEAINRGKGGRKLPTWYKEMVE